MLPEAYSRWLEQKERQLSELEGEFRNQAEKNLRICRDINQRIMDGVARVALDDALRSSFRLANRAMAMQHSWDSEKSKSGPLVWRPFQLGFILLAMVSL